VAEEGDHIAATIGQPPGDAGADRPALLQSALDALDVGVSLFDVNLNAVAFNRRFLEILDLPVGQFRPGDPFAAFIRFNAERGEYGPGDVEEQVSERVTLARRFETHRFERTRPDGLVIEIDGRPLPDGGFITTYTDMTARRCAEAETARLAAIVETTDAAIFTQDTAGRVSSWNAGAARLFGYDAGEMLGQRLDRLDLGEGTGESSRLLRRALRGEPVRQRETRRRRKDGHPVDVILTVTPMLGDNGKPVGVSTVAHDDTARKQGEAALVRAKDASEEATRTKSEFLANMSHEIRTPMNGVIGMTELLSETELDSVQREYVETVRRSAGHLLSIVDDVLDFSKIEAGKLDLEAVPFNLSALVEDSCSLLAERARSKGLELLCFVQSDVPRGVVGDPTRLAQVLTNLLGNAVKFTHRGEVVVRVTAVPAGTARARLRFEVEDTGIGISPQQCERLFQPFSQGDGSTTRRFGGTGLGLSISRQLVGLMGGSLEVSSDPGHGSVFSFELDMEERPLRGLEANPGAGLDGFRLLVVDDNATNCTILSHHLQTWGVDHDVVGDAGRALDLLGVAALRGIPYGLVLADYHMPGTDGLELTRRIKLAPGLRCARRGPGTLRARARDAGRQDGARAGDEGPVPGSRGSRAAGRRQRGEPQGRDRDAAPPRARGGNGARRPRGAADGTGRALRSRAHGLPDARARRPGSDPATARFAERRHPAHADHRTHGQRHEGRPRPLPRGRHGRLSRQAGQARRAGALPHALAARRGTGPARPRAGGASRRPRAGDGRRLSLNRMPGARPSRTRCRRPRERPGWRGRGGRCSAAARAARRAAPRPPLLGSPARPPYPTRWYD
jgi:PAS domain S-box-containing protein